MPNFSKSANEDLNRIDALEIKLLKLENGFYSYVAVATDLRKIHHKRLNDLTDRVILLEDDS